MCTCAYMYVCICMNIEYAFFFHLKFFFFFIRWIYAGVFGISGFELNPLDGRRDIGLYVHFMTVFRSDCFHLDG